MNTRIKKLLIRILLIFIFYSSVSSFHSISGQQEEFNLRIGVYIFHYSDVSTLGMREDATDGFDFTWDMIDTPPPPRGVVSYFWHPDYPTTPFDMRKVLTSRIALSDNATWEYIVSSVDVSGQATISWNTADITDQSPSTSVHLLDDEGGPLADMIDASEYVFYMEAGVTYTFLIRVSSQDIEIGVTLIEPADGTEVEMPVALRARVTDTEGDPLSGVPITFYIDDAIASSNASDAQGYATLMFTGEPGVHVWSANSTQPGYVHGAITSQSFTFSGSNYNIHRFDVGGLGEVSEEVLVVDGVSYLIDDLPVDLLWEEGTGHQFEWLSPVSGQAGSRYNWDSTTGLTTRREGFVSDAGEESNITASYAVQHYLSVDSNHGIPTPTSGWIDEGTTISASILASIPQGTGMRHLCTGWAGNGSVPSSGSENRVTFTLETSSYMGWTWKTQVKINILSSSGGETDPEPGEYWVDTEADFTATAFPATGYRLSRWEIDGVALGIENPITFDSDAAHTMKAIFTPLNGSDDTTEDLTPPETHIASEPEISSDHSRVAVSWGGTDETTAESQLIYSYVLDGRDTEWSEWTRDTQAEFHELPPGNYTLRVRSRDVVGNVDPTPAESSIVLMEGYTLTVLSDHGRVYGGGIYPEGTLALFGVAPLIVSGESGERLVFEGWTASGPGGYPGQASDSDVEMRGDIVQTANWRSQYSLTIVSAILIEGNGWYDEGSSVILEAGPSQGFPVRKAFKGWSGDIESDAATITVTMDGPKTVRAEWSNDLTLVYAIGALLLVVIVLVAYFFVY